MATATKRARRGARRKPAKKKSASGASAKRVSRLRQPRDMTLSAWQTELRRQFGPDQDFKLENIGAEPIFSEFHVTNPTSGGTYRVAIRGIEPGVNFCSCADFATNMLGTCKHVEFTLARLQRKRGGKRALADGFQPDYSEVHVQYGAEREIRFRPGSECPVEIARLASRYFDAEGKLRQKAFGKFETFLSKAGKIGHDLRVYEDALGLVAEVRDAERRRQILAEAYPRGIRSAALKKLVNVPLYDYQREGALFAARAGRSLIGDEMGLGKTVQAIAACQIMARHFGVERVLIVCPTSLKHQWEREIDRFSGRVTQVIGGLRSKRAEQFTTDSFYKITNYDTVHRDLELIDGWKPDLVILDEAQRIKNWSTRLARSVKKIDSPYCIVLTGTPLENRLEELVSIVQFIDRHRLGPTYRFLHEHQIQEEDSNRVVGYKNLDRIAQTLKPVLLRRRKKEVLDQLPERLEKYFFVSMTPQQWKHHDENREIVVRIVAKWRRYKFLSESDQRRLMIALQYMRMSCNSTFLLDKKTDFGTKADELATLLEEIYEEPDTKVVVFSQWVRMHELLERRFDKRGWDRILFHGGVPGPKRKHLIDRFREDPACRAFLSTDAGGVGLNLQHASVVVNMDLPWNPAVLEQRIGRVHRLGQRRPVRVVNFVSEGTIEQGMLGLLGFKKSLFAGVLDGGEKEIFLGGSRLTKFMETVEKTTTDLPAPGAAPVAGQPAGEDNGNSEIVRGDVPSTNGHDGHANGRSTSAAADKQSSGTPQQPTAAADPLATLIQNGLALLGQLAGATQATSQAGGGKQPSTRQAVQVIRDEEGGSEFLKISLPNRDVVDKAARALNAFLESLASR